MAHTAPSLPFVAGVLQRENFHAPKRRRASVNTPTTTPTVITHREKHHSCAPGARQHLWKGGRFLRGREKPEGGFQTCFCPFLFPFFSKFPPSCIKTAAGRAAAGRPQEGSRQGMPTRHLRSATAAGTRRALGRMRGIPSSPRAAAKL